MTHLSQRQLGYLRAAGFDSVDVYWKRLENVIYGGAYRVRISDAAVAATAGCRLPGGSTMRSCPATESRAPRGSAYWRLELEPSPHLITYTLDGEHYAAAITFHAGHLGELPAPFPLHLDPAELTRRRERGARGHAVRSHYR